MSSSLWLQVDPGPGQGWRDKAKKWGWEQTVPPPSGPCSAVAQSHRGAVRMEPKQAPLEQMAQGTWKIKTDQELWGRGALKA